MTTPKNNEVNDLSKLEARRLVGSLRNSLPNPDSPGHCQELADFLSRSVPRQKHIVVFDAMAGEVDVQQLISAHPDPASQYAVTRTPDEGFALTVHPWGCQTERHRYGFDQPLAGSAQIADADIGAVLVPAIAFDKVGGRLGRGKGYYDRFLERLGSDTLRIGITGDFVAMSVPTEDHDISMTHLAGTFGVLQVPLPDQLVTHRLV